MLIELADDELPLEAELAVDASLTLETLLELTVLALLAELGEELAEELLAVLKLEELLGVD